MYFFTNNLKPLKTTLAIVLMSLLIIPAYAPLALAAINPEINYQGKLTDSSGVAVSDDTYHMKFRLYSAETGGTALWEGNRSSNLGDRISVTSGLFSVMLGSSTALTSVDFNQTLWLEVEIGGTASTTWETLTPRKKLGTVPSAFEADKLDGIDSTSFLRSDVVDTMAATSASTLLTVNQSGAGDILNLLDGGTEVLTVLDGGNLGVGTSSPWAKLSVEQNAGEVGFSVGSSTATSFVVDASGRVGIGTASPAKPFDVQVSEIDFRDSDYYPLFLRLNNTAATLEIPLGIGDFSPDAQIEISSDGGASDLFMASSNDSGDGDLLIVKNSGNVGIGTTSPYAKLSVVGEIVGAYFTGTTTATSTYGGNIAFSSGADRTISISNSTSGGGNNLTIKASDYIDSGNGGNLILEAGGGPWGNSGASLTLGGSGFSTGGLTLIGGKPDANGGTGDVTVQGATGGNNKAGGDTVIIGGNGGNQNGGDTFILGGASTGATYGNVILAINNSGVVHGNVGIGTTSPYAKLSVVGETVAEYFTATSTVNKSLFTGGVDTSGIAGGYFIDNTLILQASSTNRSTLVGVDAGLVNLSSGIDNTFIGYWSGRSNTGGDYNVAVGNYSLDANNGGAKNTAFGYSALSANTSASDSTAIGYLALLKSSGISNTAVGSTALIENTSGQQNTAVGDKALQYNETGSMNTASGRYALNRNSSGSDNVAVGNAAGYYNNTGSYNTFLGVSAGQGSGNGGKSGNTIIGYQAGYSLDGGDNYNVMIGYQAGFNELGSNKLYIANSSTAEPLIYGEFDNNILSVNGSLGIGTTSPYAKLSVVGETVAEYFTATSTTATTTLAGGLNVGSGGLVYDYSTGNVGVGAASPDSKFVVEADSTPLAVFRRVPAGNNNAFIEINNENSSGTTGINFTATGAQDWSIQTDNNDDVLDFKAGGTNGVDVMNITYTGNVGIGTTSPYAKLSVEQNAGEVGFSVGSSTATSFVVDASGRVGVGTASPTGKFSVVNSSTSAQDAMNIIQNYGGFNALNISAPGQVNTGYAALSVTPGTGGVGVTVTRNSALPNANNYLLQLIENSSSASNVVMNIQNDGSGKTLNIDQTNTGDAIYINNTGGGNSIITTGGNIGFGTTSPYAKLSVVGEIVGAYFTGTTTATSTFAGGLDVLAINQTGSATSTFANGIDLAAGCFSINGTCVGGGSGASTFLALTDTPSSYTAGSLLFTSGSAVSEDNANLFWDDTNNRLGVGTSSPWAKLSVEQNAGEVGFSVGSSTATSFVVDASGNVGIGTASPTTALTVDGNITVNNIGAGASLLSLVDSGGSTIQAQVANATQLIRMGVSNSGTFIYSGYQDTISIGVNGNSDVSINGVTRDLRVGGSNGLYYDYSTTNIGIGTTSPYAKLSVVGETVAEYFTATSTTATSTFAGGFSVDSGALQYDFTSGVTSISSLELGNMNFETNAGNVAWVDMPVTSAAPAGTIEAYTAFIDGVDMLTIYSESDGAGGIQNARIGIGTTSPYAKLSVVGETVSEYFTATSTTATSTFAGGLNVGNGALQYDFTSGVTSIASLELGASRFETNAGVVSWMDLPVDSTTPAGTNQSYTAQLDGNSVFTIYGEADGSGGIQNTGVNIGTTTVLYSSNIPDYSLVIGNGALCVDNGGDNCDDSVRSAGIVHSTGVDVTNVDVAENYPTKDETLTLGEIVMLDIENPVFVSKYENSGASSTQVLLGVVSTAPGLLLGGFGNDQFDGEMKVPIALVGRVPVKVTDENGAIEIGDRIAPSATAGAGMKATAGMPSVGIALEAFGTSGTSTSTTGEIIVFIDLQSQALSASGGTIESDFGENGILDIAGQDILNVKSIVSSGGAWSISEGGELVVDNIKTDGLRVGSPESPRGIEMFDFDNGALVCMFVQGGEVRTVPGGCTFESGVASGSEEGVSDDNENGGLSSGDGADGDGSSTDDNSEADDTSTTTTATEDTEPVVEEETPVIEDELVPEENATSTEPVVEPEPIVVDTTAPVITLTGESSVTFTVGDTYTDAGATANDDTDGDISANIIIGGDVVDTTTAGVYTISYNVSDTTGNTATEITRVVTIVTAPEPEPEPEPTTDNDNSSA